GLALLRTVGRAAGSQGRRGERRADEVADVLLHFGATPASGGFGSDRADPIVTKGRDGIAAPVEVQARARGGGPGAPPQRPPGRGASSPSVRSRASCSSTSFGS